MAKNLVMPEWDCIFGSHVENSVKTIALLTVQQSFPVLVMKVELKLSAVTKRGLILLLHCSHMVNFYSYNYSCFICYPSRAWLRYNNIAQQGCVFSQNISLRLLSYLLLIRFLIDVPTHPNQAWSVDLAGYHVLSSLMNIYPFHLA